MPADEPTMQPTSPPSERFVRFVDPVDGTRWEIDAGFLASSWTCIWGRGCQGIGAEPAAEANLGCCSVGAELLDDAEARRVGALGLTLDPDRFQNAASAMADGVFADDTTTATRVVDGACIFLNRPGFAGGAGCALHLAAIDEGEPPIEWKPSVCWQLPLRAEAGSDGERRLRRWRRSDWSLGDEPAGTEPVAWCCTEDRTVADGSPADAYVGAEPAVETLAVELRALVGHEVYVELRERIGEGLEQPGRLSETPTMAATPQSTPTDEQWLALNDGVIAEFRANGGKCGGRWEGNPMVLLTTTGAKSGEQRTSPLTYTTDGDRLVLIASRAGDHRHPDWYHNLVANPDVVIELGDERFDAVATVAVEPERSELFDARIALMPRFGEYVEATDRAIPVVVVTRR